MSSRQLTIAIDAMGGENSPLKTLKGSEIFLKNNKNVKLLFFGNKENIQEELGDLLFSIVNLSRHIEIDASEAINQANHKFVKRFRLMEEEITKNKKELGNLSPKELEEFWVKIKTNG